MGKQTTFAGALLLCGLLSAPGFVLADTASHPLPQPLPLPPAIAAPQDVPYPGTMRLMVDATDQARRIFNVTQTIPVTGGERTTLLYPQWLPGNHAPRGQIDKLAGLIITANGKRLEWVRDTVDVFAFHVDVPAGVSTIEAQFQFLSATDPGQGRVVVTPDMMNVQWNSMALYPAGYFTRQIPVEATIKLPAGWDYGVALQTVSFVDGLATFKTTSFETLVDSPMFAGRYFKKVELAGGAAPVMMHVMADRPELLEMKPEHIAAHRNMVTQSLKLFGSYHYDRYDFLVALTNQMGGIGLEHQQSSENGTVPNYFTEWDKTAPARDLLPHEFVHSWNGKFRRPADMWTPTYSVPMRNSLLWVYEGQTQYWGEVLAARAGLISPQDARDSLAITAALYDERIGRDWKALQDTTNDPITIARRAQGWRSWQRGEDYYSEGQLMWLDADTLIREKSSGRKSLDDFAKAFFGINSGSSVAVTYTFEDVVAALNDVQPHDWATFLRTRLDGHGPGAPLDGLERGGYKLVYADTPTALQKLSDTRAGINNLTYSLGVIIGRDGKLRAVQWGSPAFDKGFTVATQIIAVNGLAYEDSRINAAITTAKTSGAAIELLVKNGDRYSTVSFDYRGGLRYPKLERISGTPARLDQILAARK